MDQLFNVKQAAYILKVHPLTIRRYIKEGKLTAIKAAGNIRIKNEDLASFQKQFTPGNSPSTISSPLRKRIISYKTFTDADPFLRLEGRAGSVDLT